MPKVRHVDKLRVTSGMRLILLCFALALSWGCRASALPSLEIPAAPAKLIALDVELPVDVPGRWTADSFSQTLTLELARYNITVVDRRSAPKAVALIDLGRWTYRTWQVIDVALAVGKETVPVGRVQITDLTMNTLDVAAESVAVLIAKAIWTSRPAAALSPAAPRIVN